VEKSFVTVELRKRRPREQRKDKGCHNSKLYGCASPVGEKIIRGREIHEGVQEKRGRGADMNTRSHEGPPKERHVDVASTFSSSIPRRTYEVEKRGERGRRSFIYIRLYLEGEKGRNNFSTTLMAVWNLDRKKGFSLKP